MMRFRKRLFGLIEVASEEVFLEKHGITFHKLIGFSIMDKWCFTKYGYFNV